MTSCRLLSLCLKHPTVSPDTPTILTKMHSFASALIAAALATLTSAAPAGLPVSVPSALSSSPVSDPLALLSGVIPSIGQLSSVDGGVGSVTGLARVRDVNSGITDVITSVQGGISGVRRRDAQLSVAAIFDVVSTETEPYIEQLSTLKQHPYDPSLTCFDSLHRSLQLHDHPDHQHCGLDQGSHPCSRSGARGSRWRRT